MASKPYNKKKEAYQAPRIDKSVEVGVTGLSEFSGVIQEEFLRELRGKEGYKKYNEMRKNSPIVGAMLSAIQQSIRGVSWEFISDIGEDDQRLEFLKENIDNMSHSWNDHIIEALTMLPFGFSVFEIVYKKDGGRWMWRKFAIRGQDTIYRWLFDNNGGIEGFEQQALPSYNLVTIPIEKCLLYRTVVERNNPEGLSILRTAWIPYYYAKHIQQIEAIGIERDLAGLPVIHLPDGADVTDSTTSDLGIAKKTVRNIRNDEQAGIVIPSGWQLELLSTGGTRQFDTDKIVKRYESRMLMSALAQFLMLGQEQVGSLALSKDQTDFFTMSVNATADIIAETFSKYAIPRLLKLNGMQTDGIRLEHTPAGDVDVDALATMLNNMKGFITWMPEDEIWLRQTVNLPDQDIEVLKEAIAEKQERDAAFTNLFNRNNQVDENSTEYFGSDPVDNDIRLKRERQYKKAMMGYFEDLQKRIEKGVKEI